MLSIKKAGSSQILLKRQKPLRRDIQHIGYVEQRIQRDAFVHIRRLQMSDERRGAIHFLRELFLFQPTQPALVSDFQPDLAIAVDMGVFHSKSLPFLYDTKAGQGLT